MDGVLVPVIAVLLMSGVLVIAVVAKQWIQVVVIVTIVV